MKILWINNIFLHPTNKGGQIRTLEMLRRLHQRHEIHYVAFDDPANPEGPRRSHEYSTRSHPVAYQIAPKRSARFLAQLAAGVFSPLPVVVSRKRSPEMRRLIEQLTAREQYDCIVCDFLTPSINIPNLERCLLFQHNVETMIWRRYVDNASDPVRRAYFRLQARRLENYERRICRLVARVVAVSDTDAETMRKMFDVRDVVAVPTGVDVDYFEPPDPPPPKTTDLAFVGSMDWLPNVDGIHYFVNEVLPLIRKHRPGCSLSIIGRTPPDSIAALGNRDPLIRVTGTVPDIRPHVWSSKVSIVPLRIGGGTRLKIYESMAARVPVVSTSIGAEGLDVRHAEHIRLADSPDDFARHCLDLLDNTAEHRRQAAAARELVESRFSWDRVACCFETFLTNVGPKRQ
jgi:sugar transferase (PEP-CTERM/EpsH1 system associated)